MNILKKSFYLALGLNLITMLTAEEAFAQSNLIWRNPLPQGESLSEVIWTGSQLVAVSDYGNILTSPDGITWTARVLGTTFTLSSVTWTGSQLVAVG